MINTQHKFMSPHHPLSEQDDLFASSLHNPPSQLSWGMRWERLPGFVVLFLHLIQVTPVISQPSFGHFLPMFNMKNISKFDEQFNNATLKSLSPVISNPIYHKKVTSGSQMKNKDIPLTGGQISCNTWNMTRSTSHAFLEPWIALPTAISRYNINHVLSSCFKSTIMILH